MISTVISAIPQAGKRGVDTRDVFVTKQEAFQDALYLTTVGQLNAFAQQVNDTATDINDIYVSVEPIFTNIDAIVATGSSVESIEIVSDSITNVNTVGNNITSVNAVGNNITSVNAVGNNIANVSAVGSDMGAVILVSDNIANVSAVGSDMSAVVLVSDNIANVNAVGNNIANVNAVGSDMSAVVAVATAIQGGTLPTIIDDTTTSSVATWSSSKIDAAKQDILVSNTNIKTVNGTSILGSGDITTSDDTKLPLAGGTMTGAITAIRETKVSMAANNIDLATGNLFTKTISEATTLTVSNVLESGNANSFILELTNAGVGVITWWSGMKWEGGTAPILTAAGVDILGFYSHDGGITWRGMVMAKDSK